MKSKQKVNSAHRDLAEAFVSKVTTDQTSRFQNAVNDADKIKEKLETRLARARKNLERAEARLMEEREDQDKKPKSLLHARAKVKAKRETIRELTVELREARKLVKESRSLLRGAERRQRAFAKAVLEFITTWQEDYDRQYVLELQNVKARHLWLNTKAR